MAKFSRWSVVAALLLVLFTQLNTGLAPGSLAAAAPVERDVATSCTNAARFVSDVTIRDRTILPPGQAFTKTWRLRNTGSCTWSTSYKLVRDSGASMNGPASVWLSHFVAPDSTVDISVQLVAPAEPGTYTGYWQLANDSGQRFGPKIKVVIIVPNTSAGTTLPDTASLFPGGGGGASCTVVPPRGSDPLVTVDFPWNDLPDGKRVADICVFGLPAYSDMIATLRAPSGMTYSSPFYVGKPMNVTDAQGQFATTAVEFGLVWPDNLPNGGWLLAVEGDRYYHETWIDIASDSFEEPELRIEAGPSFSLFDTVDAVPPSSHSYPRGEQITFVGHLYPANSQVALGVYRQVKSNTLSRYELVDSISTTTNSQGQFRASYRLPEWFEVGAYYALAWNPELEQAVDDDTYGILGLKGTRPFYVRPASDSPLPEMEVMTFATGNEVRVWVMNVGRTSSRGGSITISSPDVTDLTIEETDVNLLPSDWSDCGIAAPHAWVLTANTTCHKALQHNTACKKMVNLSYPMAEAWYRPWPTAEYHTFTVHVWPRPGVRDVRVYARAAMLAGPSGCRIELSPQAGETGATDQQGFPVQVATIHVTP